MSDLKKLIEGLPIEKKKAGVQVGEVTFARNKVEGYTKSVTNAPWPNLIAQLLGWRVILALMDEAEQKPAVETSDNPFQGPHWDGPRVAGADGVYNDIAAYKRDCNLRDELRRLRGGE